MGGRGKQFIDGSVGKLKAFSVWEWGGGVDYQPGDTAATLFSYFWG